MIVCTYTVSGRCQLPSTSSCPCSNSTFQSAVISRSWLLFTFVTLGQHRTHSTMLHTHRQAAREIQPSVTASRPARIRCVHTKALHAPCASTLTSGLPVVHTRTSAVVGISHSQVRCSKEGRSPHGLFCVTGLASTLPVLPS